MTRISSRPSTGGDLTPAEFARLPDPPLLLDVRSGVEYGLFHAPQARNLNLPRLLLGRFPLLQSWVLPPWFRTLPKTEEIAVICLTAHRSPIAAAALTQAGFTTVFNLTGGMIAWQKADLPVCKGPTSVTAAE